MILLEGIKAEEGNGDDNIFDKINILYFLHCNLSHTKHFQLTTLSKTIQTKTALFVLFFQPGLLMLLKCSTIFEEFELDGSKFRILCIVVWISKQCVQKCCLTDAQYEK